MAGDLQSKLSEAIGAAAVSDESSLRSFMANDVYHGAKTPALVVRPESVDDLQAAVRICAAEGQKIVPRGGGASYTDGYLYKAGGHVLFDMSALTAIAVDEDNAVVTVEAGVTWAALKEQLDKRGLRTPFWGPFSGIAATVGGSLSQNTVSHGTSAFGVSSASALSMDVVLASGELMTTSASSATRHYGPDLTGLFTGDCGALGLKARITLPLIAVREHFVALSFAFDDFASYLKAERLASRAHLDDSRFGLGKSLSQGQIGKQQSTRARLQIAREIMRTSPGIFAGLKQLSRMAIAGEGALVSGEYMCHFIIEGIDPLEARAKANSLRNIIAPLGREIVNTIPAFVRAMPFAPLNNTLGPGGERWVPLHGILPNDKVQPFHDALAKFYGERKADMERLGIWQGEMFSPVGSAGFLYEIALYWPDQKTVYHETMIDDEYLEALPEFEANAEASKYVDQLKTDLVALYADHGAAHFQIGRAYPYQTALSPEAKALIGGLKAQLDPENLMNPGVLGL